MSLILSRRRTFRAYFFHQRSIDALLSVGHRHSTRLQILDGLLNFVDHPFESIEDLLAHVDQISVFVLLQLGHVSVVLFVVNIRLRVLLEEVLAVAIDHRDVRLQRFHQFLNGGARVNVDDVFGARGLPNGRVEYADRFERSCC